MSRLVTIITVSYCVEIEDLFALGLIADAKALERIGVENIFHLVNPLNLNFIAKRCSSENSINFVTELFAKASNSSAEGAIFDVLYSAQYTTESTEVIRYPELMKAFLDEIN